MFEDYIGRISFEKTRKIQLENKSEDYGEEPEYEIVDEIEDVEDCDSPSLISVPNFSGGSLSRVTLFIRLSRFSFAFGSSMTQCTSSTLNQTSIADSSILRYTNFPLLESSTLATINSGKSKE
jgi:hypothetical protein